MCTNLLVRMRMRISARHGKIILISLNAQVKLELFLNDLTR